VMKGQEADVDDADKPPNWVISIAPRFLENTDDRFVLSAQDKRAKTLVEKDNLDWE